MSKWDDYMKTYGKEECLVDGIKEKARDLALHLGCSIKHSFSGNSMVDDPRDYYEADPGAVNEILANIIAAVEAERERCVKIAKNIADDIIEECCENVAKWIAEDIKQGV